ncbi:hypothetical protein H7Y63_01160 [Polaromonas sp.]|nr:hypothetical protein [Candidatus Saccharibacteria bacterium]
MRSILQKSQAFLPAAALAILVVAGSPAVALASRGSGETETATSGTTSTSTATTETSGGGTSSGSGSGSGSDSTRVRVAEVESTEMHATSETSEQGVNETGEHDSDRTRGDKMVKALRAEHKSKKSDGEREKVCETRKSGLETKFTTIARNGKAYQTRIDDIYAKAKAYQLSSGLNPIGYDALKTTADAAQVKSLASVTALADAKPTVDCTNKTVATDVATFKVTASNARTDLKAYKQAVKAVVKSLRDAKKDSASTTTENETEIKPTESAN